MRVFHGISPVSLQSTRYLADALKAMGCDAEIVVYRNNGPLLEMEDKNLNLNFSNYWMYPVYAIKVIFLFMNAIRRYDVFHFHFGHSLLPMNADLWVLKKLRKTVIMEYHGSDIRYIVSFVDNDKMGVRIDETKRKKSFRVQKRIARNADAIVVHDEELRRNVFEMGIPVYTIPLRMDTKKSNNSSISNGSNAIKIVHAPTNRGIKGTQYIIDTIERLKEKYRIDFVLIEKMTYDEACAVYSKADIILDQLIIGTYGMLAIEGMAQSKVVVCYVEDENSVFHGQPSPLCSATVFTLYDKLAELIERPELREDYAFRARKYIETYHDSMRCAEQFVQIYKGSAEANE